MNKRLLFVVNAPWFFVSHRLPIALKAKSLGYDVHVATSSGEDIAKIESYGIMVHKIPFARSSVSPLNEIKTIVLLYRLLINIKPDIVHNITIKPVLYGSFVSKIVKTPCVVNAISGLGYVFLATGIVAKIRQLLVIFAYRFVFHNNNTKVIFQNPDDKKCFLDFKILKESQIELIRGSGVELSDFQNRNESNGTITVVMASRMLWDKGVGEFVEAARLLKKQGVVANFKLVGDIDLGNPKAINKEEIIAWCTEGVVEWIGFTKNIAEVFSKSHIVCLPSYREGLPKVLVDASAAGRAIVTTDVPGCRHAIEKNVTGLLVPVRDASALAEAVKCLILDRDLRKKMGEAGRILAEREYDIQKIIDKHLRIYAKCSGKNYASAIAE